MWGRNLVNSLYVTAACFNEAVYQEGNYFVSDSVTFVNFR
jgi:hypothetical protein